MGMLDHWQPVARSRELGPKPLPVTVAGVAMAVFRTASGTTGAIADACPHRRMKLSLGKVIGERLRCPYHGWSFDACGNGESPASPKMTTCTTSYDTREAHGLIWVKSRESNPQFPVLNTEGYTPIGVLVHDAPAPLELVVDNFNEIEHSGTVHENFGYALDQLNEVKVQVEAMDDQIRVANVGPAKRLPRLDRWLVGVRSGDLFHDDWTTHFSPVYSEFNHWWTSADGERERLVRWRVFLFYVPINESQTRLFSLAFAKSRWPLPGGGLSFTRWYIRQKTDAEIRSDVEILRNLADHNPGIEGLRLGRFDKVLGLTRERIRRIYRGEIVRLEVRRA